MTNMKSNKYCNVSNKLTAHLKSHLDWLHYGQRYTNEYIIHFGEYIFFQKIMENAHVSFQQISEQ